MPRHSTFTYIFQGKSQAKIRLTFLDVPYKQVHFKSQECFFNSGTGGGPLKREADNFFRVTFKKTKKFLG